MEEQREKAAVEDRVVAPAPVIEVVGEEVVSLLEVMDV